MMMKKRYKLIMILFMLFSISSSAQNIDTIVVTGNIGNYNYHSDSLGIALRGANGPFYGYINTTELKIVHADAITGYFSDTLFVEDTANRGLVTMVLDIGGWNHTMRAYDTSKTISYVNFDLRTFYNNRMAAGCNENLKAVLFVNGGNNSKYYWDFGDGTFDTTTIDFVYHQYTQEGLYPVKLFIEDSSSNIVQVGDTIIQAEYTLSSCPKSINVFQNGGNRRLYATINGVILNDFSEVTWDLGDGNTTTNPYNYTYANDGVYNVCMSYKDSLGCSVTICDSVTICQPPGFAQTNMFAIINDKTVQYKVKNHYNANDTAFTFLWYFGDGDSSTLQNPTHTYAAHGTYQVTLIGTTGTGCSKPVTITVTTDNSCGLEPDFTYKVLPSNKVEFNPKEQSIYASYYWDFDDGVRKAIGGYSKYTHTYAQAGTYEVCHSVRRDCHTSICKTVRICSHEADFTSTINNTNVNFAATVKDDSTLNLTYSWDFGDNSTDTGKNTLHNYSTAGTYTVCVTISGLPVGACDSVICKTIVVCTTKANFTAIQGNNDSVTFTALFPSSSYSYYWSFGDGKTDSTSGATVKHKYSASGQYNSMLIVRDTNGCETYFQRVVNYNHPNGLCLSGNIFLDSAGTSLAIDSAIVYLIEHDSSAGTLTAIDSVYLTDIDSNHYKFCGLMQGKYLIKAALLSGDPSYNDNIPTYYQSSTQWSGATEINAWHTMGGRNIWMVGGTNPGGPGFIGGLISAGANKTNNLDELILTVILKDENGKPIAYREMDANHEYSFDGLPYGTYKLAIDIPGKTTAEYTIVLTPTNPKKDDADFIVKSTNILTSVKTKPFVINNNVYPNPASDVVNVDLDIKGTHTITLELVDMQGRVVTTTTYNNASGANTFTLITKDVQAGVYMLRIKTNDFSTVNKIIISK